MKYSSYSNELIDQYDLDHKKYHKVKNMLQRNSETERYARLVNSIEAPFCESVKSSIKFKLTGANFLLRNGDKPIDFLKKFTEEVNLPYPKIVFEVDAFLSGDMQNAPTIMLLEQIEDFIYMKLAIKNKKGIWVIVEIKEDLLRLEFNRKTFDLQMKFPENALDAEQMQGIANNYHSSLFGTFVSFVCALSCKNTQIENSSIQPSKTKNTMRKNKGKLPFFTHKILTIDGLTNTTKSSNGGSHSSPRIHLRRGHIRRLPNKNVWVNSCVVGDKSKGVVSKDYLVV